MNEEHAAANGQKTCAIAVVGMACRFPGDATNIEALWEMLRDAKDAWSEIPSDRFNAKGWYHPNPNRPGSVSLSFLVPRSLFDTNNIVTVSYPWRPLPERRHCGL